MSYQLVSFEQGGPVRDLLYVFDPVKQSGTYSLVQNQGYFRRSVDGVTWSGTSDYAAVDTETGEYKLVYGAGKYAAALTDELYLFTEPTTLAPTGSWASTSTAGQTLKFLHGSGNLVLAVSNVTASNYDVFRTYKPSTGTWSTASSFDFFTTSTVVPNTSGVQNTRVLALLALSSGLYAALVENTGLTDGSTTTTSTTTSTTPAYPYNFGKYSLKVFNVDDDGAVTVLYNLGVSDAYTPVKLVQVRNYLYIVCTTAVLTTKLTTLAASSTFSLVTGTNIPTFVNIANASTNGRFLLVHDDHTGGVSTLDTLHVYNPSTRVWTDINIYSSAKRPTPAEPDYSVIVDAPGQVFILDGDYDLYRSFNLSSWTYVKNTVIRDIDPTGFFFANGRPFLIAEFSGLDYLIVKERVTKVSPTFVPKCN